LVLGAPIDVVQRFLMPPTAILESLNNGEMTRAWGTTDNPYWLAARLAAIPCEVRVLQPEGLKVAMRQIGERMLAAAAG
jgi:hypothetical protein